MPFIALVAGLVLALSAPSAATAAGSDGCPNPSSGDATCGVLTVPENRLNPASRTIDIPYAVIPASVQPATGTPMVVMAPGLGQSAAAVGQHLSRDLGFGTHRDVVVLEQRGGTASTPNLNCPGATNAWIDSFTSTDDTVEAEGTAVGIALSDCLADFIEAGGDPNGYTIAQTAADVVDLRNKLQIPTWTLFGSDWSSKVMTAVAGLDAAGSDAVLLDSYSPAAADIKGEAYAGLKTSLAELSARSGVEGTDYAATVAQLASNLDDDPFKGPVTNPFTGNQRFVELEGNDFVSLVQQLLTDPAVASTLPLLFDRLEAGDTGALAPFVALGADAVGTTNWGQYLTSTCLDQKANWSADPAAPAAATPAEGEEPVVPVEPPLLVTYSLTDAVCAQAGITAASTELRVPPTFTQPTLILAGSNDPISPAATAQAAAGSIAGSQFVTFTGAGHEVLGTSACAAQTAVAWLDKPGEDVSSVCDHDDATTPFVTASSIHETSRAASVVRAVDEVNWFELLIPIIFFGFCALWFVGWVITLIVRGIQRERLGLLIASGISPVSGLVFGAILALGMASATAEQPALALVGVPSYFPYLGILLAVGLFALIVVWKLGSRGAALLASTGVIVWLGMLAWFAWIVLVPS
ncbi:alpha/beta fold hydrolase [Agreia pratensis]|uniref:Alpha/beta hydrolase fold n=1 Tax=Agreia pratensis TaxID=150121 RepID=A0A1X7K8J4_9MICO|nr:alpha/beta hydrolase [Agreia pratensis]MBF4634224.1 alpha/beta fold hydrolase [Agreia pratensis]SMG37068.1 alpha/beta hydrolase fold [Agreia pratensis]